MTGGLLPTLALSFAPIAIACGGDGASPTPSGPDPNAVASVTIAPATLTLAVRDTATLRATALNAAGQPISGQTASWSSSDTSVVSITASGLATARKAGGIRITATIAGKSGTADVIVRALAVARVSVLPIAPRVVRSVVPATAVLLSAAGDTLTGRTIAWESSDTTIAQVDGAGSVVLVGAGAATLTARSEGQSGSTALTVTRAALAIRGVYTQFERRGWPSGYYSGDVLHAWNDFDGVVGRTTAAEVADQLERIRALGANAITFELRSTDAVYDPGAQRPPTCNHPPSLGLLWPQPQQRDLDNLAAFLDLAQSKGIKVLLRLVNTHMDDRTTSERWLGPTLRRVVGHPALELVLFEGDEFLVDADGDGVKESCGGQAEPPLWLGPENAVAQYVQWAIGYAHSLGFPWRQLSAQAALGNYQIDREASAGPSATDRHLWQPVRVMKTILDRLNVPEAERTYALSLYEGRRCRYARSLPCTDATPDAYADESLLQTFRLIGFRSPARVVAVEMGVFTPVESGWNTPQAIPSLVAILRKRGAEGGSFWRWTAFEDAQDADATLDQPIKRRGVTYTYTSARDALVAAYLQP